MEPFEWLKAENCLGKGSSRRSLPGKKRVAEGAWTHEITQRVHPSSKDFARVQVRLTCWETRTEEVGVTLSAEAENKTKWRWSMATREITGQGFSRTSAT